MLLIKKLLENPKIMSYRIGLLDLEKHFGFYGAYHSNHINVIIHTILVWPNVFGTLIFLYSTSQILDLSQLGFVESLTFDGVLRLDIGFILTVIYAVFYICLDKKSGILAALLCFSCWIGSSFLAARIGHSLTLKVSPFIQLFPRFHLSGEFMISYCSLCDINVSLSRFSYQKNLESNVLVRR